MLRTEVHLALDADTLILPGKTAGYTSGRCELSMFPSRRDALTIARRDNAGLWSLDV